MFEIVENVKLEMKNVLSFKGEVAQQDMSYIMQEIEKIVLENGAEKNGPIVTATFDVHKKGNHTIMAVQVLLPLSKAISVPNGYELKPIFRLNNAIKVIHKGNPEYLQESVDKLMQYIEEKGLMTITPGYNIALNVPNKQENFEEFCAEVYVGVCDNIL